MATLFKIFPVRSENGIIWPVYIFPLIACLLIVFITNLLFPSSPWLALFLYLAVIPACTLLGGRRATLVACVTGIMAVVYVFLNSGTPSYNNWHLFLPLCFVLQTALLLWMIHSSEKKCKVILQKENHYRNLLESTEDAFFIIDQNLDINYCSPYAAALLETNINSLQHKSIRTAFQIENMDEVCLQLLKILAGTISTVRLSGNTLETSSGKTIWTDTLLKRFASGNGQNHVLMCFHNITDKIIKEKQQEDFIHMATHELKTPVTVIKGYLQILQNRIRKSGGDHHDQVKILDRTDSQINKLLDLIADMLDTTRIKTGELNYYFKTFDLNSCIKECVHAIKAASDCHITCSLSKIPVIINGDRSRIEQVIINLLTNAIKYSPKDNHIHISTHINNNKVKVTVKDNGIGIPQEQQKHVFERFYRVDKLSEDFHGLGLGLYICAEIIRKHKGEIGVDSEVGKGSLFWFSLPLAG